MIHPYQRSRMRGLYMESLESRLTLTANPVVLDVNIDSTQWSADFTDHLESEGLGDGGYSIIQSSVAKLPWSNADQIHIRFDQDVAVDPWDLALTGVSKTNYEFADFGYDSSNFTATWTLTSPLGKDALHLDLNGDGLDPVSNANGDPLQGGDFELEFSAVAGDANGSSAVTSSDEQHVQYNFGNDVNAPTYDAKSDLDGSGHIDSIDMALAQGFTGDSLPTGDPAGKYIDSPSSYGLADITATATAKTLALDDVFADQEDATPLLTYQIVDNSAPELFTSISIDQTSGELTLDFDTTKQGTGNFTIRATDTDGLSVDVPVAFDLQPPSFDFADVFYDYIFDTYEVNGRVVDEDGGFSGQEVLATGPGLSVSVSVAADGMFSIDLPEDYTGSTITLTYTDESGLTVELVVDFNPV